MRPQRGQRITRGAGQTALCIGIVLGQIHPGANVHGFESLHQNFVGRRRRALGQHVVEDGKRPQWIAVELADIKDIEVIGREFAPCQIVIQRGQLRLVEFVFGPRHFSGIVLINTKANERKNPFLFALKHTVEFVLWNIAFPARRHQQEVAKNWSPGAFADVGKIVGVKVRQLNRKIVTLRILRAQDNGALPQVNKCARINRVGIERSAIAVVGCGNEVFG